jgi:FkbM family methyltransferase
VTSRQLSRVQRSRPAKVLRALRRAGAAITDPDRRRAFKRELFFRVAARFIPTLETENDGLRFLVSTTDRGVGMTLFMGDDVERQTLEQVSETLAGEGRLPLADTDLVDIGANIGTTTINALARLGMRRAVCFEPLPLNLRLLRQNLLLNDLQQRVEVHPLALSDRTGSTEFEIAPGNPSDSRVRAEEGVDDGWFGEASWDIVTVPMATLDSQVEEGAVSLETLGLVWIDAQGHEGHILSGAQALLRARIPVVIEFWPYGLRRAGGIELLTGIIRESFSKVVDLGGRDAWPAADAAMMIDRYRGTSDTDLLLLP